MTQRARPEEIPFSARINGTDRSSPIDPRARLVDVLRERFDVRGVRVGCGNGDCGSCTALVDGVPRKSCLLLAAQAEGRSVETLESLAGDGGELNPLQRAFVESYAFQCGFCIPGMVMSAMDLLSRNEDPSDEDVRQAIDGNICRCTGYQNIVAAVRRAADSRRDDG